MKREEAINIVRNIYQTDAEKEALQALIPELRESEDERIRRELVEYLKGDLDDITTDDTDRWINWLEKQKEQMSEWRVLPGCEELTPEEKMNHPLYLEGFDMGREVQKVFDVEWSEADEVYLEDALWCVEKAEKSCKNENDKGACWSAKRWLKSLRNSYKPEWNEEDEKMIETICKEGDLKPSEQRWLKSLPERFNLQSKQEWSKEDYCRA